MIRQGCHLGRTHCKEYSCKQAHGIWVQQASGPSFKRQELSHTPAASEAHQKLLG